jgi:prefoldin beta subunit
MASKEKIEQLSLLEKSNQNLFLQKQQFQSQLLEIENALKELDKTSQAFKQVGNLLVLSDKKELHDELKTKKEVIELRIKTLETQEAQIREKAKKLQDEILSTMKERE